MHFFLVLFSFLVSIPFCQSIECYSGSQLQIINCPSQSCIKQTLGLDTVRYCDGTGVSSICQTYRITESCDNIPNLGSICCCSGNLCNSSNYFSYFFTCVASIIFYLIRYMI